MDGHHGRNLDLAMITSIKKRIKGSPRRQALRVNQNGTKDGYGMGVAGVSYLEWDSLKGT
jgi:hypothetical protein